MSQPSPVEVAIVGIGRLGGTVATVLERSGHRVHRVRRHDPIPPSPITWLTVPDGAIASVARRCPGSGVLLHASGACDLSVLGDHPQIGSLHPLMTFPGSREPELPIPAAVSGTPRAQAEATKLARALGWHPFDVPGDRRAYHAAAVIAGNFATTLLAEAAAVLESAGVSARDAPALLAPLALQSLRNAARIGPAEALTGPVVRGDQAVIEAHRAILAMECPDVLPLYETMLNATRTLAAQRSEKNQQNRD